jgi:PhnB protein
MPQTTEIIPYLYYRDVPAAIEWLERAFGFSRHAIHETPRGGLHAEMTLDGRMIMMGSATGEPLDTPAQNHIATQGVFVWLADVDAHFARAHAAGADIVTPPADQSYGRTYWARDPEQHDWFFATPPAA